MSERRPRHSSNATRRHMRPLLCAAPAGAQACLCISATSSNSSSIRSTCNVARAARILTCRRVDVDGCQVHGSSGSSGGVVAVVAAASERQRQRSSGTVRGSMGHVICAWVSLRAACDWTVLACVVPPCAAWHHICARVEPQMRMYMIILRVVVIQW